MTKLKKGAIALVSFTAGAFALSFGLSSAPAEANQTAVDGRIIGRFVDSRTNFPIAAEIAASTAAGEDIILTHAMSSRLGEFAIDGLEPGQIHLVTKAEGYAVEHRDVVLREGDILRADFQLKKVKKLRGTVRRPNGSPISGANVRVIYPTAVPSRGAVVSTYQWETGDAATNQLGAFLIDIHPEKEFVVEASHPEFLGSVSAPIANPDNLSEIVTSLSLKTGVALTGEVRDQSGAPLSGVQVRLLSIKARAASPRFISGEALSQRIKYSRSGADGTFRFDQLAPGRKILIVVRPGYRPYRREIDLPANQSLSQANVVLNPT